MQKFKVGQKWKDRSGNIHEILNIDSDVLLNYPVETGDRYYSIYGELIIDEWNDEDLVELVEDPSEDQFLEEHLVKQKDNVTKIYAKSHSSYSPHVKGELLFKMKNTGNGYISKCYTHSSVIQDHYLCFDYAEAEYLYQALKLEFEGK